jgi:hypothetical protein
MISEIHKLAELPDSCHHESKATWAQKIFAIKRAVQGMTELNVREVEACLDRGIDHMKYKDFTEFDCENEDEYIFGEAVHLIEYLNLPFHQALKDVLRESCWDQGGQGACVQQMDQQEAVFGMADALSIAGTVKLLQARLEHIRSEMNYVIGDAEKALEAEQRIVQATLVAIKAEYPAGHFDASSASI